MTMTMLAEIATVAVFVWGIITFRQDVALRRADHFGRVRNDLVSNDKLAELLHLVEHDDERLAGIGAPLKKTFVCVFEEVELLRRASLMKPALAYHMFGQTAINCADSHHFWSEDFPRDEDYWGLSSCSWPRYASCTVKKCSGEWSLEKIEVCEVVR
jgi:hypothetical protein